MNNDDTTHENPLRATEDALEQIRRARLDLEFRRLAGGTVSDREAADLDRNEGQILQDPDFLTQLNALSRDPDTPEQLKRSAGVLAREALEAVVRTDANVSRITASLEGRFDAFHPWWNGQTSRFADIGIALRSHPDRERREAAWFAAAPLGEELEAEFAMLFEQRNRVAGIHGFTNFPALAFEAAEIDRLDYLALCDELEQLTRSRFEESLSRLRDFFNGATLEPWDLNYGFEMLAGGNDPEMRDTFPATFDRAVAGWGITSSALPVTHHDADPGQGLLCLPVDPEKDVRIAGDLRDDAASLDDYLRAMGTALHFHSVTPGCGVCARDRSPLPAATGALIARMALDPQPEMAVAARLYRLRRRIADSLFEVLAYEKPGGDLHSLHCEIAEHYLGFPRHPERWWATDVALVSRPLHAASAVLAEVVGSDLRASLANRFGDAGHRDAGEALSDKIWKPADSIPWIQRVSGLTGTAINPEALLVELGGDSID